jgi:RNA polymerase sigma-70 factor (ECF subfamily)
VPSHPEGWLLRVARRKAIDRLRRMGRWREREQTLAVLARRDEDHDEADEIPDERLRLIFTCCHPALDPKSRVALTLRALCGLTTAEIARAFLDTEATMGQRLSRAKAKIAKAGIPFRIPEREDWDARLGSVLAVIYLVFNEGYAATSGDRQLRVDLCDEAIFLGRMLAALRSDPEIYGLMSLMLTTHSRRAARGDGDGRLVPLADQDRNAWDRDQAEEGLDILDRALVMGRAGPFQIKAAISALHVSAPDHRSTDWRQMLLLYDALLAHEPSDVVRLNRFVVLAELGALGAAIDGLRSLEPALAAYQPFHAARADLLARAGEVAPALDAYETAISLSKNAAEREFLQRRRAALTMPQSGA